MFTNGEIDGIIIKKLELFSDSRGWLMELFREDNNLKHGFDPVMSYISVTKPSVARGPHEHIEQTDYFCFLGNFNLYLWDNRKGSPTYNNKQIIENTDRLIVIVPPGIVHAYKNMGQEDAMVLNFPDRLYAGRGKKEKVDEVRYEDDPESPFKV
ncbi:MAG: dTDP-4-dehydrorhamnose 3,5-epimerase family protein [Nitrospirae bacterium]|nr:dTDP-4-dehydrorhamnose 3,5-epimerase family protein [Nitrospirota bacterium]